MLRLLAEEAAPGREGGILQFLILMAPMIVIFYFLLIRPQRKQQQRMREMIAAIAKNDRVLTTGGIIGTVTNIKDDEFTIRIDDDQGVKVRIARSAVTAVLGKEEKKEGGE